MRPARQLIFLLPQLQSRSHDFLSPEKKLSYSSTSAHFDKRRSAQRRQGRRRALPGPAKRRETLGNRVKTAKKFQIRQRLRNLRPPNSAKCFAIRETLDTNFTGRGSGGTIPKSTNKISLLTGSQRGHAIR